MCYCVMNHVTDYDVWHTSELPVTVEMVIEILNRNTELAQKAIHNLILGLPAQPSCQCCDALSAALITHPSAIPQETRQRLHPLLGKYLDREE